MFYERDSVLQDSVASIQVNFSSVFIDHGASEYNLYMQCLSGLTIYIYI